MDWLGGHIHIGPITIYGRNAMHWAVNIRTRRWGYICFRLPLFCFGRWWPLYYYLSPVATPQHSTYYLGSDVREKRLASYRKILFNGHGYDFDLWEEYSKILQTENLNDWIWDAANG